MSRLKFRKHEYLDSGGVRCPYCSSDNISGGSFDVDTGIAFQDVYCMDCHKTWFDMYKLVDIKVNE